MPGRKLALGEFLRGDCFGKTLPGQSSGLLGVGSAFSSATARRQHALFPASSQAPFSPGATQGPRALRTTPSLMPGTSSPAVGRGPEAGNRPANGDPETRGRNVLREGPGRPRSQSGRVGWPEGRLGTGAGGGAQEGSPRPHPDPPSARSAQHPALASRPCSHPETP